METVYVYVLYGSQNNERCISLYSINWLDFITQTGCAFCAVRTKSINKICSNLVFKVSIVCATLCSHLHIVSRVRRCADKFCLNCNIFIYIRHIWIKPVLCSRMVSLFHHTSP